MRVGSLILAGGRSRRMGKPKESLTLGGKTLLGRAVETLLHCTWPVVVVARGGDQQMPPLPPEAEVIHDDSPDAGPLLAIAKGMRHLRHTHGFHDLDALFVTGCDSPYLTAAIVGWLRDQLGLHQCVVPRGNGFLQPLCAIYRLNCLPEIDALLLCGIVTPRTIVEQTKALVPLESALRKFDPELHCLNNLNTPEDFAQALRDFGA